MTRTAIRDRTAMSATSTRPSSEARSRPILDDLERRGFGPRFVLIGLCAGGYWAFHTGAADPRVVAALIINPRAMIWDAELLSRREARKVQTRCSSPRSGGGSLAARCGPPDGVRCPGRSPVGRPSAVVRLRRAGCVLADPADRWTTVAGLLDALSVTETRVVLAFSSDEPVYDELAADGLLARLDRWPNVVLEQLPGHDHTLRPMIAQRALHRLLDAEFDRLIGRRPAESGAEARGQPGRDEAMLASVGRVGHVESS